MGLQFRPRLTTEEYEAILKLRKQDNGDVSKNFKGLENTNAKILFFDLETSPMLAYSFQKWKTNISDDFIVQDWGVLCWSAKWLFEDKIISHKLNEEELPTINDERIMYELWKLIDSADIIVAHNLKKFDEKKANTKFLKYGFGSPSPYNTIDTLLHLRKRFAITSNRLDYVAKKFFEIEGKMQTETGLWRKCMDGDFEALNYMAEYCNQDVKVLEDVYLLMRGWIKPHPNVGLQALSVDGCCPVCSSKEKTETATPYRTYVNEYSAYRCNECSHIYRERKAHQYLGKENIRVSTPN